MVQPNGFGKRLGLHGRKNEYAEEVITINNCLSVCLSQALLVDYPLPVTTCPAGLLVARAHFGR